MTPKQSLQQSKSHNLLLGRWQQNAFISSKDVNKRTSKTGPISWKSLLAFVVAGGGVMGYVKYLKNEKEKGILSLTDKHFSLSLMQYTLLMDKT